MNTFATHRNLTRDLRILIILISAVCGVGLLCAVVPAVEHAVKAGLIGLAVLAALTVTVRLGLRLLRERREDRQDEITAAAWRAAHHHPVTVRGVA